MNREDVFGERCVLKANDKKRLLIFEINYKKLYLEHLFYIHTHFQVRIYLLSKFLSLWPFKWQKPIVIDSELPFLK